MASYLFHPIAVHFPIVLLLAAPLLVLLLLIGKPVERLTFWVLGLGAVSAWVARYTGELAEDQARHVWQVPREAIHAHERAANNAFILAVLAFGLFWVSRHRAQKPLRVAVLVITLLAAGAIGYTGYEGGEIVYTHAIPAASDVVAVPSSDAHGE